MSLLLGGEAGPIGWTVQFLRVAPDALADELLLFHADQNPTRTQPHPYPEVLDHLPPFEAPWTRELVLPCGPEWSAYLNNFVNGGDPSASGHAVAARLGVDLVVATHTQMFGPGHAQASFETGDRHVTAHCEDGRWSWHEGGDPLPFEDPTRYTSRRIRDRLDRPLLVQYLYELGIPADDDSAYGPGVVIQQHVSWRVRQETLEEARRDVRSAG
jgi:hypothetical protein